MGPGHSSVVVTGQNGEEISLEVNYRQMRFIDEYMKDHNGRQAAIRAGYKNKEPEFTAYVLLRKPHVIGIIRDRERQLALESDVDEGWVINQLKENMYRAIEDGDLAVVNKSLELIGKQIGMFVDRSNIKVAFDQIERVERRIIDPVIEDVDYSVEDKDRRDL